MLLRIIAVGRMKNDPTHTLYKDYIERIDRMGASVSIGPCTTVEIDDRKSHPAQKGWTDKRFLEQVSHSDRLLVFDENGTSQKSKEFAAYLQKWRDQGTPRIICALGPAEGHGELIKTRANDIFSFGSATWPHLLARVMLAEQIYRGISILNNHPYHRE